MAPGFMGGSVDEARREAAEIGKRDAGRGALASATIALHEKAAAGAERILGEALARSPGDAQLRTFTVTVAAYVPARRAARCVAHATTPAGAAP